MKAKRIVLALWLASVMLGPGACQSAGNDPLDGTSWKLVSLAGAPALPLISVTLEFKDGQAGGVAGCNSYGGGYQVKGNKIEFDQIVSTMMACADQAIMDQESAYLQFLGEAGSFDLANGQLQLYRSGGDALVFTRVE